MDKINELLKAGDMHSDGNAPQVAESVLKDKKRLVDLLRCLDDPDSVVRAHAAHAIEAITRSKPEWLSGETRRIIPRAESDAYPTVRWHMAMTLGNLAGHMKDALPATECLLRSIKDTSPLVRSWSVYSLVAIGRDTGNIIPASLQPCGRTNMIAAHPSGHVLTGPSRYCNSRICQCPRPGSKRVKDRNPDHHLK